jgi:hypothetical protein
VQCIAHGESRNRINNGSGPMYLRHAERIRNIHEVRQAGERGVDSASSIDGRVSV